MRDDVPVYASPLTKELICEVDSFVNRKPYYERKIRALVPNYKSPEWKRITIGDITVIPWTVDHSAAEALGFIVFNEEETIFYSGDIRFHGRKTSVMRELRMTLNKAAVDVMLLEGTNLRKEQKPIRYRTENDVFIALEKSFKEQGENLGVIYFSSQNVDRFCSVYKACIRANRTLVIDPYTARCLQAFHKHYPSIPSYWQNNIAILSMGSHIDEKFMKHATGKNYSNHSVTLEEIYTHPEQYEVKVNFRIEQALFEHFKTDVMNLIFSQWEGYIKKNDRLVPLHENNLVKVIHCSGHAYKEDLDAFIKEVKPKKLIPIHTEHGELMLR